MSRNFAATVGVNVGDNFFSPSAVTINVNDTVSWSWVGLSSHSSTSNTGLWDSGIHGRGFSFSRQFTAAGNFPYFCRVHPFQTGSVAVQQANSPPTVAITSPADGAIFNAPASFTIMATASDTDGSVTQVEFFRGASSIGIDAISPYTATLNDLAAGTYRISAVATDNAGAKATNSITITVNALPVVKITNPTDGLVVAAPASITVQADASDSDGSIAQVEFLSGSASLGVDTSSPYSIPTVSLASGTYTLLAVATDNRGAKATNSVNIIVNAVPTVAILAPANEATFAAPLTGIIQATASDSDGTVTKVEFFGNSTSLGSVANPPYDLTVTNLAAGIYTLTAVATDNQGATNISPTVTISVVTPMSIVAGNLQRLSATEFQFSYTANPGLNYVVERSANLPDFTPISTNSTGAGSVTFTDSAATNNQNFYRVRLFLNP